MRTPEQQKIVDFYRAMTDGNAPPWVAAVVDQLAFYNIDVAEIANAIQWCDEGDAPYRAEHLLTIVSLWPGPRKDVVTVFIAVAREHKAGRSKAATTWKHVQAVHVVHVWRSWNEKDAADEARGTT